MVGMILLFSLRFHDLQGTWDRGALLAAQPRLSHETGER